MKIQKIILVPIDSRPVTYTFPQMIAETAGIEALSPPRQLMGCAGVAGDVVSLGEWLEQSIIEAEPDAVFVCLDSLLYGGLVASRCSQEPLLEIMGRAERVANWKKLAKNNIKVFVQASIMRIPHYNASGAEPPYWQSYGAQIFRWSVLKHKQMIGKEYAEAELKVLEEEIPGTVQTDFLARRERNFRVNQYLVELARTGGIDYLVFSQDDTGEFGLNVWERTELQGLAKKTNASNVMAYPGTDETIMTLMTRWLLTTGSERPTVSFQFSPARGRTIVSNFEGQPIEASVKAVADLTGVDGCFDETINNPDVLVVVHTGGNQQGDHIKLAESPDMRILDTNEAVEKTIGIIEKSKAPVILCDVAYSNGSDPALIEALFKRKELLPKLCAYAGWNTTNNTVGSALALGIARLSNGCQNGHREEAFKRALFVRFADDWAYQTQVRAKMAGQADNESLGKMMRPYLDEIKMALKLEPGEINVDFPWKRTFEIEIDLPSPKKTIASTNQAK